MDFDDVIERVRRSCDYEGCDQPVFSVDELKRGVHRTINPDHCAKHDGRSTRTLVSRISKNDGDSFSPLELATVTLALEGEGWQDIGFRFIGSGEYEVYADADSNPYSSRRADEELKVDDHERFLLTEGADYLFEGKGE